MRSTCPDGGGGGSAQGQLGLHIAIAYIVVTVMPACNPGACCDKHIRGGTGDACTRCPGHILVVLDHGSSPMCNGTIFWTARSHPDQATMPIGSVGFTRRSKPFVFSARPLPSATQPLCTFSAQAWKRTITRCMCELNARTHGAPSVGAGLALALRAGASMRAAQKRVAERGSQSEPPAGAPAKRARDVAGEAGDDAELPLAARRALREARSNTRKQ